MSEADVASFRWVDDMRLRLCVCVQHGWASQAVLRRAHPAGGPLFGSPRHLED